MAGALHRLLSNKENELATVRCQLKELSHSHTHTLVILHERNRDVERLNSIIANLRDQAISRDIELAGTQQALQASEADHDLKAAKHQSDMHALEAQIGEQRRKLDREEAYRTQASKDHATTVSDLREAAAQIQTDLQKERARNQDLTSHCEGLQDHCSALQNRIASLESHEAALQDRCGGLTANLRAAELHGATAQERCTTLQTRLASQEAEMGVLQQQMTAQALRAQADQEKLQQAIAMRDGQLSDQEMILQRRMDLSEQREREQTLQLEVLTNNFDAMRANCAQQEREINALATERLRLDADKSQLRASVTELSSALTATQMDRDRACEASARDSASLRTTQLQLSTANGKLHEAILRERSMDALARERAIEASRQAERRLWEISQVPSAPALSPRAAPLSPRVSPRPLSPSRAGPTASSVLDASRNALMRAQHTLDSFQAAKPPPPPPSYGRALSPARLPTNISPSPNKQSAPSSTPEDLALRAEMLKWAANGNAANSGAPPATNIQPNPSNPALMTSPRSSPRPLPVCLSASPYSAASARAATAASKAMAAAQAAQTSARASGAAARARSPLRPYSGPTAQ